ncbi:MAG: DUF1080 domain-containing protein [Planctomycetes bacterium]|nr:DUF1080 domain-containing protein [Planctomycetota bacterium]
MWNIRVSLLALMLAGLFLAAPARSEEAAVGDAISPADNVIRLFDGKTLGDCYTWLKNTKRDDPRQVFRVKDGMLHITGDGLGGLVTNKRYRDYHLVLEYKWGERTWYGRESAARDSGLLIHSNGIDGGYNGTWMPSIEVQIIEGGVGDFVPVQGRDENGGPVPIAYTCNVSRDRDGEVVWNQDGPRETFRRGNLKRVNWYGRDPNWTDTRGFRGKQDRDSPLGEWTRLDVFCDGGHIETFVNGKKVNEAFDASPREGRLQLQSELAEIYYRRWELWPLGKGPKPELAK